MQEISRVVAASEVLDDILVRHRPAGEALADWGKSHRFAGSGDRNAIGGIVYDALRRRASIAWAMNADTPRALALGAAQGALGLTPDQIADAADGSRHAPEPLTDGERAGLARSLDGAPDHVRANVPEWLWPSFVRAFRERAVRIPPPVGAARTPNLQAEAGYQAGWFEVQDEGSQIASRLTGAGPRQQVLDLCAGGGGKTLAMGALLQNTGQIYAYDTDRHRLKPIFERIRRAGVRNVQVLRPGEQGDVAGLEARFDVVLVDAPCTGTGVWRRRPEAKWRLKAPSVGNRQDDQKAVLALARPLVKPGGRLVYVTCSLLPEENVDQVAAFLAAAPEFSLAPYAGSWVSAFEVPAPISADGRTDSLLLTPGRHGTDGFFIAVLQRSA
jgi:16S rRNA (cytosine967-C5)-methyltransferase